MNNTTTFSNNEKGYKTWLSNNPNGYVINARKKHDPEYIVLHRAHCYHISKYNNLSRPGGFTERSCIKICSNNISDLKKWARENGRPGGSFSKICSKSA